MSNIKSILFLLAIISIVLSCDAFMDEEVNKSSHESSLELSKNNPFNFIVIGHAYPVLFQGTEDQKNRYVQEIKKQQPEALLFGGDALLGLYDEEDKGQESIEKLKGQFQQLENYFSDLDIPIWIAPGNHELVTLPGHYKDMTALFEDRFGALYYERKLGDYSFYMLNTVNVSSDFNSYKYTIGQEQINWLKAKLESNASSQNFILLHHPLWYAGEKLNPSNGIMPDYDWNAKIHPYLKNKVDYVFGGDGGYYGNLLFNEKVDNVNYYVTGSNKDRASFLNVQVSDEGVEVIPHFIYMK